MVWLWMKNQKMNDVCKGLVYKIYRHIYVVYMDVDFKVLTLRF